MIASQFTPDLSTAANKDLEDSYTLLGDAELRLEAAEMFLPDSNYNLCRMKLDSLKFTQSALRKHSLQDGSSVLTKEDYESISTFYDSVIECRDLVKKTTLSSLKAILGESEIQGDHEDEVPVFDSSTPFVAAPIADPAEVKQLLDKSVVSGIVITVYGITWDTRANNSVQGQVKAILKLLPNFPVDPGFFAEPAPQENNVRIHFQDSEVAVLLYNKWAAIRPAEYSNVRLRLVLEKKLKSLNGEVVTSGERQM